MVCVLTDNRNCILSVCRDDLSGCSDWQNADIALTPNDDITDGHGAALYRLENGELVVRPEEERRVDWPVEEEPEPTEAEQLAEAARILFGEVE